MKVITVKAETIPYEWRGVTFGKFKQICQNATDEIYILSLFVGVEPDVLRKAKVENFEVLMARLKFLYHPPIWDETPRKLGDITMPKDITFESTGQFEDMRAVFKLDKTQVDEVTQNPLLEYVQFAKIAAIYYQPLLEKADYKGLTYVTDCIMDELDTLSCVEVVSLGRFFYAKLVSLSSGIPMSYLTANIPLKKKRRGFESLMRSLTSTRLYRSLRGATSSSKI